MSIKSTFLAVVLSLMAASASAVPMAMAITGGFEFFASGAAVDTNVDGTDDAFDFINVFGMDPLHPLVTEVSDGILDTDSSIALINTPITGTFLTDFGTSAGFSSLGNLTVKDISIGSPTGNNPFLSLMVSNGDLNGTVTFTADNAIMVDGADPLDMLVTGQLDFIAGNGCVGNCYYESTAAKWTISSTGQNSIVGASVPEPGTLALLGLGLAGLGFARRKQTQS